MGMWVRIVFSFLFLGVTIKPALADNPANPCTYEYPPPAYCEGNQDCGKKIGAVSPVSLVSGQKVLLDYDDIDKLAHNICTYKHDLSAPPLNPECDLIKACINEIKTDMMLITSGNTGAGKKCDFSKGIDSCELTYYNESICDIINHWDTWGSGYDENGKKTTRKEVVFKDCKKPSGIVIQKINKNLIEALKPSDKPGGEPDGESGGKEDSSGGNHGCAVDEIFDGTNCVKGSAPEAMDKKGIDSSIKVSSEAVNPPERDCALGVNIPDKKFSWMVFLPSLSVLAFLLKRGRMRLREQSLRNF